MNKEKSAPQEILIADNDYFFATFLEDYFASKGYVVNVVSNGKDAIEKLKEKEFYIAIIDLHMPKISGTDVLNFINKKIKKEVQLEDQNLALPITILVSSSLIEQFEDITQLGADFLVPKAPSPDMKEILDNILAQINEKKIGADSISARNMPVFPRESSLDLLNEINYYHHIFESLPFGVVIFDRDSTILKVNRAAEGLLRRQREDLLGQEIAQIFSQEVVAKLKDALYKVVFGSKAFTQFICELEQDSFWGFVCKLDDKEEPMGWILAITPLSLNQTK